MKQVPEKLKTAGLIMLCAFLLTPSNSSAKTPEHVFKWVSDVLGITETYPMPTIIFLNKPALQSAFKESNKNSRKRWSQQYGDKKANQMMQMYMKELLGLFDPKSKKIYIGSFIEPCQKQAVLAHEITHYFQVLINRTNAVYYGSPGELQFIREMEAYSIEKRYRKLFCGGDRTKG